MERFFDFSDNYTQIAMDFDSKISAALKPIFDEAESLGYSLRDLSVLINGSVQEEVCGRILSNRMRRYIESRRS